MITFKAYNPPTDPMLDILYSDEDILILNKPSGLLSVPGKAEDMKDCLESRAQAAFTGARIVHRLDMETSGVIVMARHLDALRHLGRQFEDRKTEKTYEARVWGKVADYEGEIDLPLICDWPNRPKQMVCHERGKNAVTRYRVIAREADATRVALFPVTGRSHQLRVHMLSLGHPILGDNLYATGAAFEAAPRLQLHAKTLSFTHPETAELVSFAAPVPF
ncbi:MAG: RluA family pseudouridine synthase [Alphaproteobacteria bacterium]|nr:RluA family pseudouridine synthase [Alphaproteobacteria bacterium]